ncbi:hypothetical protein K7A41_07775 [Sphingobacterium sp. InxBP1]|uniref:hypothetical protein n=1 Tax=Sphingobacterium sp. InxBP1 TaxID=2870328 RepID=UPI002242FF79|nr:hypothetical protein [Sphingobacterium sp. InxBP1]MCW8311117.1 hypothetical protein [Sphingobacterium sp. InxBP1]
MWWNIAICVSLSLIALQDFKQRAVNVTLFIILGALLIALNFSTGLWQIDYIQIFANLLFLLLQLGAITLYFRLKTGTWQQVMDQKLGWGDIAFLACLSLYLPFLSFFVFYASSLFIVLPLALIKKKWRDAEIGIPLAGCQALLFLGYFIVERAGYINWEQSFQKLLRIG